MNIIYSGGWNKYSEKSVKESLVYSFADVIKIMIKKGKKVGFVTLAKPDGRYDGLLQSIYDNPEIINSKTIAPDWQEYDGLIILGGDAKLLQDALNERKFSLPKLKNSLLIIGDSAGAYILSTYFYHSPPGEKRGFEIEFLRGFNPEAKVITIAHTNNPVYCNDTLITKVEAFAREHDLQVLKLTENEQMLNHNGEFIPVEKNKLLKNIIQK